MNKIKALLVVAFSTMLLFVFAGTANAYSTGYYGVGDGSVTTNVSVTWINNSGTGIILTGVNGTTNNCGGLEGTNPYTNLSYKFSAYPGRDGDLGSWSQAAGNCSFGIGLYKAGNPTSYVYVKMHVRRNNAADYDAYWHFRISQGGGMSLLDKGRIICCE